MIGKLSGEKQRWDDQVQELKQIEETLPSRVLIAAGFNTYLAKKPEDVRDKYQYFTEASMNRLRDAGYEKPMTELEDGVQSYVIDFLHTDDPYR